MFFVVVIRVAGAIIDAAKPIDGLRLVQQGIRQRGLPASAMPDERNGANVFRMILEHDGNSRKWLEML